MDTIDLPYILSSIANRAHIQLFSDGGYREGRGASAFAVVVIEWREGYRNARLAGAKGSLLSEAASVFQAEVVAADMATKFAIVPEDQLG